MRVSQRIEINGDEGNLDIDKFHRKYSFKKRVGNGDVWRDEWGLQKIKKWKDVDRFYSELSLL